MLKRTLACTLLMTGCTLAAAAPDDPLDQLINQQGWDQTLAEKLQQVRQTFAQTATVVSERTSNLIVTALGFLGVPYRYGGNTAENGFDCSGFVRAMYEQTAGLMLPRRSDEQAAATQAIDPSELAPGDLVFFNTTRRAFSHVGIYMGDGKFIHAPRTGAVVRVENMSGSYWQTRFDGARRVLVATGTAPGLR